MRHAGKRVAVLLASLTVACSDAVAPGTPTASMSPVDVAAAITGNLVQNGSFEDPPNVPLFPGWITYFGGQTMPGGWSVTGNSVDIHSGEFGQPITNNPDGSQALDLNGNNTGGVEQTIGTIPGVTYKVSFYLSSNPVCDPSVVSITSSLGGVSGGVFSFVTNHSLPNMRWEPHSYTVVASGTTSVLVFASLTVGTSCGPEIDHVVVELVDTVAPSVACGPGTNPSGKNSPNANAGFFMVSASDNVGVASFSLGGYALTSGENIKITQSPGASGVTYEGAMGPTQTRHFIVGPDDAVITATDAAGNASSATCNVPPKNK